MEFLNPTYIWLIAGALLMVAELALPGGVSFFLGASAVLIAGLRGLGVLEGLVPSLALWLCLSLGLTLGLRRFLRRWIQGERSVSVVDEDIEAFGQIVDVTQLIEAGDEGGRIRYQGTTWTAKALHGRIEPGMKARLIDREDLTWIVEPLLAPIDEQAVAAPVSTLQSTSTPASPQSHKGA